MPYEIKANGDTYDVVSKDTGRIVATHKAPDAKEKAERQMHLLEAVEHDPNWEPSNAS